MTRPEWDEYFMGISMAVKARGDCSRRQVGCVVVTKDKRLASSGYNGSYPSGPSCLAGQCPRAKSNLAPGHSYDDVAAPCHATHAEANALLYADYDRLKGATVYITEEPCAGCRKLLQAVPVERVVWPTGEYSQRKS